VLTPRGQNTNHPPAVIAPLGAATPPDLPTLLAAAARGDESAWRAVVDLYARRVFSLVRSRLAAGRSIGTGNRTGGAGRAEDIAEEVTQSVFVTVASKLGSGLYDEQGKFEAWLFRVAINRLRDELRRQRRHAQPTDPEVLSQRTSGTADPHADPDMPARLARLREAMHTLSDADREVIELRHHGGLSFKQIAELLSEPLGTLLARHHRALHKLKDLIGPDSDPRNNAFSSPSAASA
jgi:RNA polymerase sigma-70 factor (ECF subfamily)